mmetsp:Transcript_30758/g.54139  ORF Transcript_30758/g.54139 Transcript_30758/m.54139 type:complete len:168 (-) Transcript_30758:84-587(-)
MGKPGMKGKKTPMTAEEKLKRVKRRVGWLNNKLEAEDKTIWAKRSGLEKVDFGSAIAILKQFEEKADSIKDPTKWIQKAASKIPERRVRNTIAWYNNHGSLPEPIDYEQVKEPLASIKTGAALKILKQLEGKSVNNPTKWLISAASREEPWYPGQGGKGGGKRRRSW